MELGWVQLSNTWRHLTWGFMNFGKAVRNFTAVHTCNSKLESWAVHEPSLLHLQSAWKLKSDGSRIWKKSNLRIVPKTWQWLSWRVVWRRKISSNQTTQSSLKTYLQHSFLPWGSNGTWWALGLSQGWLRVCSKGQWDPERCFTFTVTGVSSSFAAELCLSALHPPEPGFHKWGQNKPIISLTRQEQCPRWEILSLYTIPNQDSVGTPCRSAVTHRNSFSSSPAGAALDAPGVVITHSIYVFHQRSLEHWIIHLAFTPKHRDLLLQMHHDSVLKTPIQLLLAISFTCVFLQTQEKNHNT